MGYYTKRTCANYTFGRATHNSRYRGGTYRILDWVGLCVRIRRLRSGNRPSEPQNSLRCLLPDPQVSYPDILANTLQNPKHCLDSKSAIISVRATRNRVLIAEICNFVGVHGLVLVPNPQTEHVLCESVQLYCAVLKVYNCSKSFHSI